MGFRNTLKSIALAGALALSCGEKESSVVEQPPIPKEPSKSRVLTAFDGSQVLTREGSDGNFTFYRDKDGDGWADTKGEGAYLAWGGGESSIFKERDLPAKKYKMKDLK